MKNVDDIVQLSDDESTEETNNAKDEEKEETTEIIDTIELDDDISTFRTKVIESTLKRIYRENKLLAKFIEKCFNIENSVGMFTTINRSLVKAYRNSDDRYKESTEFENVLKHNLDLLETKPTFKFSHLKNVCEALKANKKQKKRVQLITLATNLNGNHKINKIPNGTIINLDDEDDDVICLENVEVLRENREHKEMNGTKLDLKTEESNMNNHENRENYTAENTLLESYVEVEWDPNIHNVTLTEVPVTFENDTKENQKQSALIISIEEKIGRYKSIVNRLENQEVLTDDVETSPYLECERYKKKILMQYKQLCSLTGVEPVKRRQVRLDVKEGHESGPVKKLEKFLNANIDSNGNPPFPDFSDVVQCVEEANTEQGLNWTKSRIMSEAYALFDECGKALQKKRKTREWREMLARVPNPVFEDPADKDPVLLAKLNANRDLAVRKETRLLERYVRLQINKKKSNVSTSNVNTNSEEANTPNENNDLDNSGTSVADITSSARNLQVDHNDTKPVMSNDTTDNYISKLNNLDLDSDLLSDSLITNGSDVIKIEESQSEPLLETVTNNNLHSDRMNTMSDNGDNNTCQIISNDNPVPAHLKRKSDCKDVEIPCKKTKQCEVINNTRSTDDANGFKVLSDKAQDCLPNNIENNNTIPKDHDLHEMGSTNLIEAVKIKEEPMDPTVFLNQIADIENYTAEIVHIFDPFLLLEISSDSSDDDDY